MIKFEEHEGKLFRMLEEPVPLTTDAELPCLVRLIQDDTMLGKANKRSYHSDTIRLKIVCTELTDDGLFMQGNYSYQYEIIGYLVEDGSHWWALYQMMQGKKVFRVEWECDMYCQYTNNEIITFRYGISSTINPVEEWIANAKRADFGWQIYKEPEPESQYKAGDFVEIINQYSGTKHLGQIDSIDHEIHIGTHRFNTNGNSAMETLPQLNIIRKLKPSEVIVEIGCLSGTVKDLSYVEDGIFWFISKETERCPGGMHCILYLEMLDTPTRKLVEGLLRAQEEE